MAAVDYYFDHLIDTVRAQADAASCDQAVRYIVHASASSDWDALYDKLVNVASMAIHIARIFFPSESDDMRVPVSDDADLDGVPDSWDDTWENYG